MKLKSTLFTISFSLLFSFQIFAQCNFQSCPIGEVIPANAANEACVLCSLVPLDGYTGNSGGFLPATIPPQFCGSVENNFWFAFVAPEPIVEFEIEPFNCAGTPMGSGLQAQVYSSTNCIADFTAVSNCWSPGITGVGNIIAEDLIPGNVYYLMIDAWAGDICDYTIQVLQGLVPLPSDTVGMASIDGTTLIELDCNSIPLQTYTANAPDATFYEWQINPPDAGIFQFGNVGEEVTILWNTQILQAELCVIPFNSCSSGPETCVNISIEPAAEAGLTCEDATFLCGGIDCYIGALSDENTPAPFPGCPANVLNNPSWFSFTAGSETIALQITPSECVANGGPIGLQAALYASCDGIVMATACDCTLDPIILAAPNFQIGEMYYLVVDGCAGGPCNYEIQVLEGVTSGPSPPAPILDSSIDYALLGGPSHHLLDSVPNPEYEYIWEVQSLNAGSVIAGQGTPEVEVLWEETGTFQLCVSSFDSCALSSPSCTFVQVIGDIIGSSVACLEGNSEFYSFTGNNPNFIYSWELSGNGNLLTPPDSSLAVIEWTEVGNAEICLTTITINNDTFLQCLPIEIQTDWTGAVGLGSNAIVPLDPGWVDLCLGETLSLTGLISNGQIILQNDEDFIYNWHLEDTMLNNEKSISYLYAEPGCYFVMLEIESTSSCVTNDTLIQGIRVATLPEVEIQGIDDYQHGICEGTEINLSATVQPDTLVCEAGLSSISSFSNLAIPDGTGSSVVDTLSINNSDTLALIMTDNLIEICVNMEHSWLRDLEIKLTCPNGTEIILHDHPGQVGGEIFLGEPIDSDGGFPIPGIGYDYCWTIDATNPTWIEYANANMPETLPAGDYTSFESMDNLIGCPINGDWILTVTDLWAIDNGFLFSWEIHLGGVGLDEVFPIENTVSWLPDSSIIYSANDSIIALPTISTTYQLLAENNFGCSDLYEIPIEVFGENDPACYSCDSLVVDAGDDAEINCNTIFPIEQIGTSSIDGDFIQYQWHLNGDLVSETKEVLLENIGLYIFTATNLITNCTAQDSLMFVENLDSPIANAGDDMILSCFGSGEVILDASQSEPGPNILIAWIAPDGVFLSDEIFVEVSTPGIYVLMLTNTENGCVSNDIVSVFEAPPLVETILSTPDSCNLSNGAAQIILADSLQNVTYNWSTGDSTALVDNLSAGVYEVTVSTDNCEEVLPIMVDSLSCVNVSEIDLGVEAFQILPNPNNGQFQAALTLSKAQHLEIKVLDVLGRNVYELPSNERYSTGKHRFEINLENESDGLYFLQIKVENKVFVRKVVKGQY